jgi:glutathione S-transferase
MDGMTALLLYIIPGTCSLCPHILLEQIGEPFEVRTLDRAANEQRSPTYLSINPRGKVPALVAEGRVVTENVAIQAFLADRFPTAGLAPEEAFARAEWLAYITWLSNSVHPAFRRFRRPELSTTEAGGHAGVAESGRQEFQAALREIDERLGHDRWACGATLTTADAYTFVFELWGRLAGFEAAQLPNIKRHLADMHALPAVRRALDREGLRLGL